MKIIPNSLFDARKAAGLTRAEMGAALGVAENYIYLIESGRKPYSPKLRDKVEIWKASLPSPSASRPGETPALPGISVRSKASTIRESPSAYGSRSPICRYTENCDLAARFDKLEAQMQTLTQLLGAALAASSPAAAPSEKKKAG